MRNLQHSEGAAGRYDSGGGSKASGFTTLSGSFALTVQGSDLPLATSIPIFWPWQWDIIYLHRWLRPSEVCTASPSRSSCQCCSVLQINNSDFFFLNSQPHNLYEDATSLKILMPIPPCDWGQNMRDHESRCMAPGRLGAFSTFIWWMRSQSTTVPVS